MTNTETIKTIAGLALQNRGKAAEYETYAAKHHANAATATEAARHYLDMAGDYTGILRHLDPADPDAYPDPTLFTAPVVTELHALAQLLAAIPDADIKGGIAIQVHMHKVAPAQARALVDTILARDPDAYRSEQPDALNVVYGERPISARAVEVGLSFHLEQQPSPAPLVTLSTDSSGIMFFPASDVPFAQATPAEVAEAYAGTPQRLERAAFEAEAAERADEDDEPPYAEGDRVRRIKGTAKTIGRMGTVFRCRHDEHAGWLVSVRFDNATRTQAVGPDTIERVDDSPEPEDKSPDDLPELELLKHVFEAQEAADAHLDQADEEAYQDYLGDQDEPPGPAPVDKQPADDGRPFAIGNRVALTVGDPEYIGRLGTVKTAMRENRAWCFAVLLDGETEPRSWYDARSLAYVPDEPRRIKVGDRCRVQTAFDATGDMQTYDGRLGRVAELDDDAYAPDADPRDLPIAVLLDGDENPSMFAVAEVTVIPAQPDAETAGDGQDAGQPE